jgi:RHS repeat-associated protein
MGCLQLPYYEKEARPNFLGLWKKSAGKENCDNYYAFGLAFNSYQRENSVPNDYKFNGKEEQNELGLNTIDFGWRQYDPAIARWNVVDPLSEKRYWMNPYNFVQNNPINRFDPNGLTDFTLNKKTGAVTQVGEKNDDPDRILKTNRKGEVKHKKNGEAKVAVGGIEQGILKDGQNFKTQDQVVSVGGEGQASVDGVKSFTLKLSEYVGKEIKGFSYSSNASGNATDMVLGKYTKNDLTTSFGSVTELVKKYGSSYSSNNILQEFHTHPNGQLGATQSAPHLSDDVRTLQSDKPQMPNASFIILYRILGQEMPGEYDYTHEYRPKKK